MLIWIDPWTLGWSTEAGFSVGLIDKILRCSHTYKSSSEIVHLRDSELAAIFIVKESGSLKEEVPVTGPEVGSEVGLRSGA